MTVNTNVVMEDLPQRVQNAFQTYILFVQNLVQVLGKVHGHPASAPEEMPPGLFKHFFYARCSPEGVYKDNGRAPADGTKYQMMATIPLWRVYDGNGWSEWHDWYSNGGTQAIYVTAYLTYRNEDESFRSGMADLSVSHCLDVAGAENKCRRICYHSVNQEPETGSLAYFGDEVMLARLLMVVEQVKQEHLMSKQAEDLFQAFFK